MKNEIYDLNTLYHMIKNHFMINFPHKIIFNELDVINEHLNHLNKSAEIQRTDTGYHFDNPSPTVKSGDFFSSPLELNAMKIESYFSQPSGIEKMAEDIYALYFWLQKEGYIDNGVATEKMLVSKGF
ncbi:hypothetical protein H4F38_19575 [Pectobacterium brasiliense]|uniref:hypothetical protein n=1 Tax=Pectobacterium brasiliense TaxID=180957 RepID=UPI001968FDA8|nr:hypothetical protein [Pectobacterium brasiliense]MBN3099949.1 hypothetical protein [Pectobacterium brasiliense]MBN3166583.1 hypothetical protein [Pectobacterium brasiliense]